MTKIAFLDVAPDEKAFVTAQFSDAIIAEADAAPASLAEMEVLVVFVTTPVTDEYLKALPKLRLLCTRSAGTDHIDLKACAARGITVCSVPDYGSHVIAEHAFALLLSAVRHVSEGHARVKTGDFSWRGLKGLALKGKTIGVVGTGRIGRCAMQIAQGFGMNVLAYDVFHAPGIEYSTWEDVWQKSDVVSLHLPLTADTKNIVNAKTLAACRPGLVLVNTARGGLIDIAALVTSLNDGRVSCAALDVLPDEHDLSQEHGLIDHPRVIVTPHIAFYTDDSVRELYRKTSASIVEWQQGKKPTLALA